MALVESLSELEKPITTIEKESGLIMTEFVRITSGKLLGTIALTQQNKMVNPVIFPHGKYKMNCFVSDSNGKTKVKINMHIEGWDGIEKKWRALKSRCVLEEEIFKAIYDKLL